MGGAALSIRGLVGQLYVSGRSTCLYRRNNWNNWAIIQEPAEDTCNQSLHMYAGYCRGHWPRQLLEHISRCSSACSHSTHSWTKVTVHCQPADPAQPSQGQSSASPHTSATHQAYISIHKEVCCPRQYTYWRQSVKEQIGPDSCRTRLARCQISSHSLCNRLCNMLVNGASQS